MKYHVLLKTSLFLLFYIVTAISLNAQHIGRKVISSNGGQLEKDGVYLSWTIGQSGLSGNYSSTIMFLNSGFEQENDQLFVATLEIDENLFEISVFPNPVSRNISLNTISETSAVYDYTIVDMNGRNLRTKKNIVVHPGNNVEIVNLNSLHSGIYLLSIELRSSNGGIDLSTFKIVKH